MTFSALLLGLVLIILAIVGLIIGARRRGPGRQQETKRRDSTTRAVTAPKSRLTLISELTGIAGFVITIIGLLLR